MLRKSVRSPTLTATRSSTSTEIVSQVRFELQPSSLLRLSFLTTRFSFIFRAADIFLHCTDNYSGDSSFQIWLNRKEKGYVLAKEGRLPKGTGQVTFSDMGE